MFNRIEVWRLWGPVQEADIVVFHPLLGLLWGVLRIIVLLKNGLLLKNSTFLYAGYQVVLQNGHILVTIHPPLNLCKLSYTLPAHTSPYHNLSSPKLHSPLNLPSNQPLPHLLPHPLLPI